MCACVRATLNYCLFFFICPHVTRLSALCIIKLNTCHVIQTSLYPWVSFPVRTRPRAHQSTHAVARAHALQPLRTRAVTSHFKTAECSGLAPKLRGGVEVCHLSPLNHYRGFYSCTPVTFPQQGHTDGVLRDGAWGPKRCFDFFSCCLLRGDTKGLTENTATPPLRRPAILAQLLLRGILGRQFFVHFIWSFKYP